MLATTAGLSIWQWGERTDLVAGALRLDELALAAGLIALFAAAVCTILAIREPAAEGAGQGAFGALLLGSVLGMFILAEAQNLLSFFIGFELLSIPLYVLCGSAIRKEASLESGLKYLIIGSLGSATMLYGFALIYGATGSTDFSADRRRGRPRRRGGQDPDAGRRRDGDGRPRLQALARPVPPVDARRLPGRPHPGDRVHGGGDQGRGLRRAGAAVRARARRDRRRLAPRARRARRGLDRRSATSARSARTR